MSLLRKQNLLIKLSLFMLHFHYYFTKRSYSCCKALLLHTASSTRLSTSSKVSNRQSLVLPYFISKHNNFYSYSNHAYNRSTGIGTTSCYIRSSHKEATKLYSTSTTRSSTTTTTESSTMTSNQDTNCNNMTEMILKCTDGIELAAKRWTKKGNSKKIICLHGWLDNASSFHLMGPYISSRLGTDNNDGIDTEIDTNIDTNIEIIALDFPGHGLSSHKNSDGPTSTLSEYVLYVAEALESLQWMDSTKNIITNTSSYNKYSEGVGPEKISLIGHSMGAGVAMMFAAAFPEVVDRIVLLDGFAPIARSSSNISRNIRKAIDTRMRSNKTLYPFYSNRNSNNNKSDDNDVGENDTSSSNYIHAHAGKRKYPSIHAAINARMATATLSPGNQYISKEAATALVCRASIPADDSTFNKQRGGGDEIDSTTYDGPIYFRHDSRLMWPSLQYFTQEQVYALLEDVQCPTCLILADDGWPMEKADLEKAISLLKPAEFHQLPGSHHFHADPKDSTRVSDIVINFFS